jgi:hypothetical protein
MELSIAEVIGLGTEWLRRSEEPFPTRLRTLLQQKGIEPNTAKLVRWTRDGEALFSGIVANHDRRVYEFTFDYSYVATFWEHFLSLDVGKEGDVAKAEFCDWQDITETYETSAWAMLIAAALESIPESSPHSN